MQLTHWLETLLRTIDGIASRRVRRRSRLTRRQFAPAIERLNRRIVLSASETTSCSLVAGPTYTTDLDRAAVEFDSTSSSPTEDSEWIIQLTQSATEEFSAGRNVDALLNTDGSFEFVRELGASGLIEVRAMGIDLVAAQSALQFNSNIAYFEQNGTVTATSIPNDQKFGQQTELQRIGATAAWDVSRSSSPLVVAVVDSGIDYTSPDLYLNIWLNQGEIPAGLRSALRDTDNDGLITFRDLNESVNQDLVTNSNSTPYIDAGDLLNDPDWRNHIDEDGNGKADDLIGWDFTDNDVNPIDENGHGTHVSGILAGIGNNTEGIAGVNWSAQIMVVKFLDGRLHGETADAISALNYVTAFRQQHAAGQPGAPDVRLSNNSWEIRPTSLNSTPALSAAIASQSDAGVLLVAAAGNGVGEVPQNLDIDPNASLPAAHAATNLVSVAAVDPNDQLLINSNYGLTQVDLAAPGLDILSTEPGGTYGTRTGTSMATPFVTGTAALFWSLYPEATAAEVRQALLNGVDLVPGLAGKVVSGGRLNIERTLNFDTVAPRATLISAPNIITTGGTFQPISINYTDNVAVRWSTLNAADIVVTRADAQTFNGAVTLHSTTVTVNADQIGATYRVAAPSGKWTNADNGVYEIRWVANQVTDPIGNQNSAGLLGTFVIDIPAPDDYRVTSFVDSNDNTIGDGRIEDALGRATLRAAIQEANADPDANIIKLGTGTYTLTLAGGNEELAATGDLDLTQNVTIVGVSTSATIIDANALDRVFHVRPGITVTLKNLTLRGGLASDGKGGGGVLNEGFLTLDHVLVTSNTAVSGGGGGVMNNVTTASSADTLTVIDSTFTSNTVTASDGGGLKVLKGKTSILNSTFNSNTAATSGGGLSVLANTVTVTNSTFSANTAGTVGGGAQLSGGVLVMTNATITLNTSSTAGGGLFHGAAGSVRLVNTILAGNQLTGAGSDVDVSGTILNTGSGSNFVGIVGGAIGFDELRGDLIGFAGSPLNANLAPLANYGGATQTHRPNVGSPLIDAGQAVAGLNTDQRGLSRTTDGNDAGGARIDIGSVEFVLYGTISGTAYYDLNQDGDQDESEQPLIGWTIFLDTNSNHLLDSGERSVLSGNDGGYTFTNVPPGNYSVVEILRQSSVQGTQPTVTQFSQNFDSLNQFFNVTPTGATQSLTTKVNQSKTIILTGDDGNTDAVQSLTFAISTSPAHGTLTLLNPRTGSVLYTPATNYSGTDSFQFTVLDDDTAGGAALTSVPTIISLVVAASDYGDAPDTTTGTGTADYQTLPANGGASHLISGTQTSLFLGARVDSEASPTPGVRATGDDTVTLPDDEDGLVEPAQDLQLTVGAVPVVRVRATNTTGQSATIYGWIDYNRDGVFDNATERSSAVVPTGTTGGIFSLTFPTMPAGTPAGATYARFRFSADVTAANSTGEAIGGEIEDYTATISKRSNSTADAALTVKIASGVNGGATLSNYDSFGYSMASLGDLDGDGVNDLVVAASDENTAGGDRGAVFVQFLNVNGTVKSSVKIASGTNGGPSLADGDHFGTAVAAIGDLDGDGVTELAVGADHDDSGGTDRGAVYILFMRTNGTAKSSTRIASGVGGGPTLTDTDFFGTSATGIGDIDGDGVADLAVGARYDDTGGFNRGAVHVLRLNSNGTVKSSTRIGSGLNGGPTLANSDAFAKSVTSLGDLDGDGITDLAVGAWGASGGGIIRGATHILFLNSDGTVKSTRTLISNVNGAPNISNYDNFGMSLTSLGDVDGDGVTDLAAGAFRDDTGGFNRGAVHLMLMNTDGTVKSSVKLANSTNGGPVLNDFDYFGASIASLGDLNGDGISELAIGDAGDDTGGGNRGAVHILYLKPFNLADFGDAPDTSAGTATGNYQTLQSDNGPSHTINTTQATLYLGARVDGESNASQNARALADDATASPDDEDGLIEPARDLVLTIGTAPVVRVRATNLTGSSATLYGWIDYNRDGVFDNATERQSISVATGTVNGTFNLTFPLIVSNNGAGSTYARFRLSVDVAAANPTGEAIGGEVEDYVATITRRSDSTVENTSSIKIASGQNGAPTIADTDRFGGAMTSLGDLDGDGVIDLAVAADRDDTGGTDRGAVYVQFMHANGTVKSFVKIANATGGGPTLSDSDYFGRSLASLGDLDGDGITDLAVGAFRDDTGGSNRGAVHIVFLNANGTVKSSTKIASGTANAPTLTNGDDFGSSVAAIGDLDGDGVTDLAVGARYDDTGGTNSNRGAAYVLFMNSNGTVKGNSKLASGLNGVPALANDDGFGDSVASVGDLDGDGITDLAIGSRRDDTGGDRRGAVHVLLMNANGTAKNSVKIASGLNGCPPLANGDEFGWSLGALGDIDGDGVDDLAVGAFGGDSAGTYRGAVHVLLLNSNGTVKSSVKLANGVNGGPTLASGDRFGTSIAMLNDLDGDGVRDIAVGAMGDATGGTYRGAVHVLFLKALLDSDYGDAPDYSNGTANGNYKTRFTDDGPRHVIESTQATLFLGTTVVPDFDAAQINDSDFGTSITRVSPSVPVSIFDYGTATSQFTVSDIPGQIGDLNVSITLNHTFDGDLAITLISPSGTRVALSTNRGSGGDNFTNTIFDDEAPTLISSGTAPFSGSYRPDGVLNNLDNQSINGAWTLEIKDQAGSDTGILLAWSLEFRVASSVAVQIAADDNGLVEPAQDLALTVGTAPIVRASATNLTGAAATLYGWIDYNRNGVFDNASERASVTVPAGTSNGVFSLTFPSIPVSTQAGTTYARFRLSSDPAAASSIGQAIGGEVEDYVATIALRTDGLVNSSKTKKIANDLNGGPTLVDFDRFGTGVASLGDLDGDGINDLAVSAYLDDTGGFDRGAIYIQFMNSTGTVRSKVKIASGVNGGPTLPDQQVFGSSIAALGDVNGDGVIDLAVGAVGDDTGGTDRGAAYVLFLNADGTVKAHAKIASGTAGGPDLTSSGTFGCAVAAPGDLDRDGVVDLVVGAFSDDAAGTDRGAIFVLRLNTDGTVKSSVKIGSGVNGGPALVNGDFFGRSVTSLGDLDSDGITDLAVGAFTDDSLGADRGAVYILFLNADSTVKSTVKLASGQNGTPTLVDGDLFGGSLASVGDLDGDAVTDLAVGAFRDDTNGTDSGAIYLLQLNSNGTVKSSRKISDSTNGGPVLSDVDLFGYSIAAMGDLDLDGTPDLAVGASFTDVGGDERGAVYLLFLTARINSNSPVLTSSATVSVAENLTAVITVAATDADLPAQTLTYSLTGGVDQSRFTITSGGVLTFVSAPNFENPTDLNADNIYLAQVTVSDGEGRTTIQNLTITVTNANETPTSLTLSASSIEENNVTKAVIGSLRVTDPDAGQTFSYSLVAGAGSTDNSSFTLVGNVLTINAVTNFAAQSSYAVRVRVTDQNGLFIEQPFTINVNPAGTGPNPTVPNLPRDWSISGNVPWTSISGGSGSVPNRLFIADPAFTSDSSLISPVIPVMMQNLKLQFQNNYVTEAGFDGGVLEVAVNGGPFVDIVTAGGVFSSGGYNGSITTSRSGWTGNSAGYVTTLINLPAYDIGSSLQFRWRFLSDSIIGVTGWSIDTIQLLGKQPSWERTTPDNAAPALGGHVLSVAPGVIYQDLDFGNYALPGEVRGRKFLDVDGDGIQDGGEPGVPGETVFLDANGNGALDPGEDSATTDANGDYLIPNVPAQLWHSVVSVAPTGWQPTTFPAVFELSSLLAANGGTGNAGSVFTGASAIEKAGTNVRNGGDINGDGVDDFLMSNGLGLIRVVFGNSLGWGANYSLSNLTGQNGFTIQGTSADFDGTSIAAAGDFNHDGYDDILVSTPNADINGDSSGAAYLIFGKALFSSTVALSNLNGADGFAMYGIEASNYFGSTVSGVGDVNNDGFDDVLMSAKHYGAGGAGFLLFGRDTTSAPFGTTFDLTTLNGSNGARLDGASLDLLGSNDTVTGLQSIAPAGDVNFDGIDDLIIGARGNSFNSPRGNAYVVFGRPAGSWSSTISLAALTGLDGFVIRGAANNDELGVSVSGAGDFNGDGIDDVVVGAHQADPHGAESGAAYVIFGKNAALQSFPASITVSSLTGVNGLRLSGVTNGDRTGISVGGIGDFNGDGLSDIVIGAFRADPHGTDSGAAFVVFGSDAGWQPNFDLSTLDGYTGFRINGIAADDLTGFSAVGAGDVNGDGRPDLLVGAGLNNTAGIDAGAAFLLYGRSDDQQRVFLDAAEVRNGKNFNDRPLTGELRGTIFNDRDRDGVRDLNEEGVEGLTLFLDVNPQNGSKDPGEDTAVTGPNGQYIFPDLDAYTSVAIQSKAYRIVELVDVDRLELVQSAPQKLLGAVDVSAFAIDAKLRTGFDINPDGLGGFILSATDGTGTGFNQQDILHVSPDGQTVSYFAAADHPHGVASDGTYAYWVDLNSELSQTRIYRQRLTGGARELVYSYLTPGQTNGGIVSATGLDFVPGATGSLVTLDGFQGQLSQLSAQADISASQIAAIGGARLPGLIEQTHAQYLDVENGVIYIADPGYIASGSDHSLDLPAKILSIPLGGGAYSTLYEGDLPGFAFYDTTIPASRPRGIAVKDGTIFITGDHAVYSLPIAGGTPAQLVVDERFQNLAELTWSDNALYVIDNGTRGLATVWKVDLQPPTQRSINVDISSNTRSWDVVLTPGTYVADLDFARFDPNAAIGASGSQSIRGVVFNDTSGNGEKDGAELGRAGVTVFLDLNHTGVLDEGDEVTVTLAGDDPTTSGRVEVAGEYVFNGLSPGLYDVLLADVTLGASLTSGRRVALTANDLVSPTSSTGTPRTVGTGDFNNDGLQDVIVADSETGLVSLWKNVGDGRFTKLASELNVGGIPTSAVMVNLDGDALPDLAISRAQYGHVSLWKNRGNGVFQQITTSGAPLILRSSPGATDYGIPSTIVSADFNNDTRPDLAVIDNHPDHPRIFVFVRTANDYSFAAPQILATPSTAKGIVAAKLNSTDQAIDLAATIPGTDQLMVWLNVNDGSGRMSTSATSTTVGDGPSALNVVQANGDAFPDLAIANTLGGTVTVLANGGNATWTSLVTLALTVPPTGVLAADFDGRNGPDLAVTLGNGSDSAQSLVVFYHTGDNATPYAQTVAYGASIFDASAVSTATGLAFASANLDADTDPDLILLNSAAKTVSVLRNGPATGGQTVRLTTGGASANATNINFGIQSRHTVGWNPATGALTITLLIPSDLELAVRGGQLELRVQGVIDTQINIAVSDIASILIEGSSGADRIDLSAVSFANGFTRPGGVAVTLNGNAGPDTITGSSFGDTIDGGGGNNVLSGGPGNDNIFAGTGDDLLFGGDDNDTLNGTTGANRLDGGGGNNTLLGSTVNEQPSFTAGANIQVNEDPGAQSIPNWATNINPGAPNESSQALDFIVNNNNASLFSVAPALSPTGTLSFTPVANASGTATITIQLHDNGGISGGGLDTSPPQTFTITINPVNDVPVANAQSANTNEGTAKVLTLAGVDGDPEVTQNLTFAIVIQPTHGTLGTLNATTGVVTYTPNVDYNGPDSFTFTVTDDGSAGGVAKTSTAATVSLTVNAVNDPPTANPQSASTNEGTAKVITLTGIDGDPEVTQSLTFALVSGPTHGTLLTLNTTTGQVTYTPDADYNGSDSFTFTVTDDNTAGGGALTSTTATLSLTVSPVNAQPTATSQSATTSEGTAKLLTLAGIDNDPEVTQNLTFAIIDQPTHGTLGVLNGATGQVTYTPNADYNGTDSFTFTVTDDSTAGGAARTSTAATVSLTITPVNVQPVANAQSVTTNEGTARVITLTGVDADPDVTQTLTFAIVDGPSHGTLGAFNTTTGQITYTPAANYNGPDTFTFTVTDDTNAGGAARTSSAATVSLTVTAVNAQPVANSQSANTVQGFDLQLTLNGTDGDPEVSQGLTFAVIAGPAHGTLTLNPATGEVTYSPVPAYVGLDAFTFSVTDDANAGGPARTSSAATVSITVTPFNGQPVAFAQPASTSEGVSKVITLTGDDGNPVITRPLTFALVGLPLNGVLSNFNPSTGQVTYVPNADFNGSDSFTFTVTDDLSQTSNEATISLTITADNAQPLANGQSASTNEDVAKVITLTGIDRDPELTQTLTFAIVNHPTHGTLGSFNAATGQVTYTPGPDFNGSDSFTFTVTDDSSAGGVAKTSAPGTVLLTVDALNDKPLASSQSANTNEGIAATIVLVGTDADPEATQALTFTIVSGPAHGTLSGLNTATGQVIYTPFADYNGPDNFTFTVADDATAGGAAQTSVAATVTLTVSAVNVPPVSNSQSVTTLEGTAKNITLSGSDSDPEVNQSLTFAIVNGPAHGSLSGFNPTTGQVTYTPTAGYSGTDSFTYTVTDDGLAGGTALTSVAATVNLTVNAVIPPTVTLGLTQGLIPEASGATQITATLSQASSQSVTVVLSFTGTSTVGDDYSISAAQIIIPPGNMSRAITLTAIQDGLLEGAESISIDLLSATNATENGIQQVSLQIADDDHAPAFTSSSTFIVAENSTDVGTLTATDSDQPQQTLTYSLTGGADQGKFTITPDGQLRFITAPNFELPTDSNGDNVYQVQATVNDGQNGVTSQTLNVIVTNVNETIPAQLTGTNTPSTWIKKQPPAIVFPQVTLAGTDFGGGTLKITFNYAGKKKPFDLVSVASSSTLGTGGPPTFVGNVFSLEIQLNQSATAAAIQTYLRGITFSTKGAGIKVATRSFQITLSNSLNQSASATQLVNVRSR